MKRFTHGGVHPPENKLTQGVGVSVMELPTKVVIPLVQHIGAPAKCLVKKGDMVVVGQLIGEATGFVSANIHASIAGKVTSVEAVKNGQGVAIPSVTIVRGAEDEDVWSEEIIRDTTLIESCELEPKEIFERIKMAGIVGMGGAQFPTHVKLSIPDGKSADTLVVNGAECEPYLTSDHQSMLSRGEELLTGVKILMRLLGVKKARIGVENNKRNAIKSLRKLNDKRTGIKVESLKVMYPQGGEKQLIEAVTGRQVPPPPALPIDVGVVVVNVATVLAIYDAVQRRKPLFERVVTVSGKSVAEGRNLLARMGTSTEEMIAAVGGLPEDTGKVIGGGPMMGRVIVNLDAPITKGTSGITIISEEESLRPAEYPCFKCGKCVEACPMALEPYLLKKLGERRLLDQLEQNHIVDCIECGCCQFTCPAKVPLLDHVRLAKQRTMAMIRSRKS
ncbi:MAG: electron transport complex subunit RsxC [Rikenellaceae bacterium]